MTHPIHLLRYFTAYFKTNYFTAWLVGILLAVWFGSLLFKRFKGRTVSPFFILVSILALGLSLRIGWIQFCSYKPATEWRVGHMLESDHINVHALDIPKNIWFINSAGLPSGRRPVGYPVFLGLVYKISGSRLWAAYAANLFLYVAATLLVYAMAKLIFSERTALLSAFLFSIYPISIYSVTLMTDEHLFLPVWYLGLFLLMRELKGHPLRWGIFWYGVIFGYAAMTRTNVIFMPVVVALTFLLLKRGWKKIIFSFFGVAILMQVVNLPWIMRNYRAFGEFIPYTIGAGHYLYQTCNSSATPEGDGNVPRKGAAGYLEELAEAQKNLSKPGHYDELCRREMKRWIWTHPKDFLILGTARVLHLMCWNRAGVWPIWFQYYPGSFDPARPLPQKLRNLLEETYYVFYYVIFFCSVFGTALLFARRKKLPPHSASCLLIFGVCVFFWLAQHMIINPERKYRYPLEPFMMIAASYFLVQTADHFRPETR